jgi:hypothetical protein
VSATALGSDLLVRLLHNLVDAVPGAIGAGLARQQDGTVTSVATVGVATRLDRAQIEAGVGPVHEAQRTQRVSMVETDDHTIIVTPGTFDEDSLLLTSLYVRGQVPAEALDLLDRYEALLANAMGMVEYCGDAEARADHMLAMTQYRRVIEQAKGLVMSRRGVGAEDSFALLAEVSQRANVKLRDLAIALVEQVGGAPAEHPGEPGARRIPGPAARDAAKLLWDELGAAERAGHATWTQP